MNTKRNKPAECNCCQFVTTRLIAFNNLIPDTVSSSAWYCELCSGSMASMISHFPRLYESDTREILKSMCYIGNTILERIQKLEDRLCQ